VLITRCPDATLDLSAGLAGARDAARAAGAELARLHGVGLQLAGARLHVHATTRGLVALAPEGARLRARLAPAERERDLDEIAAALAGEAREAFVTGYREADRS
jgi:hypothetical protein